MQRAAPEDWYRIERVGHGVTHISEPFIREFYRCNMWHVRGRDRDLLVDSGMGVVSLRAWVPLVTEKRCLAVASHTHFDHIGAHHEFPDRLVHGAEAELLARPTRAATLVEPYVSDEIFTRLPPEPYRSAAYAVPSAPATRIVADGDVVDLGDRHFEVIHTPGHSPGGIALWGGGHRNPLLGGYRLRRAADRGRLPLGRPRLSRQHEASPRPAGANRARRPFPELRRRAPPGNHPPVAGREGTSNLMLGAMPNTIVE